MVDRDPVRRNAAVSANVMLHGQTRRTTASIRDDSSSEMATVRARLSRPQQGLHASRDPWGERCNPSPRDSRRQRIKLAGPRQRSGQIPVTFFLQAKGVGGAGDALFAMLLLIFSRVRVPRDF